MPAKVIENCEHCTANWDNFRKLTNSELKLVNENRYEASFRTGEIMIKQGSPAAHALFLASGMAKVYVEGLNGKNCMLGIALPGELIMSPGSFLTSRHSFSVASLTPSRACFLSISILKDIVRSNGAFAEGMLKDVSASYENTNMRLVSQAQKRMSGRLADILLYLADKVYRSDEYEMILSRQELGELATMAKECVVRILREFEDSGIINSESSRIKILDKEKLIMVSEKG
jgi:CRP/FNR family transcriptional regulator